MASNVKVRIEGENNTKGAFDGAKRGMSDLQGAAGNLKTKALDPLNHALGIGLKAAAGIGIAAFGGLVAAVGSGVKSAMSMEQQLADISASMGTTSEQTGKLKGLITDLGMDPRLKVTAEEAADAIQTLGTAGLSVDEILGGAARSTVLLANATGADFGTAAAIATDVMAQFGISAEDMAKAVDGVTSTTIASKFDINDYRLALAQAGGVAATVGVEFDDFNATIAAISPYFASGSDAGTSFKTMLQRLLPQSDDAAEAMRDLGLFTGLTKDEFDQTQNQISKYRQQLADLDPTSKKYAERSAELNEKIAVLESSLISGQNAFFNLDGSMKSMAEIAGLLNTATAGLTEEQKLNAFSTIFGTDAMRAAAAMAGMTEEEFLALKGTMAKTDAEEASATRMNTLSGAMEILWGVIDTLKMQIGDAFIPAIRKLAESFTEQAQVHGPKIVEMFRQLADKTAIALEKFMPWVEQALPKLIEKIPGAVAEIKKFVDEFIRVASEIWNAIEPVVEFIAKSENLEKVIKIIGALMAAQAVGNILSFAGSIWGVVSGVGKLVAGFWAAMPVLSTVFTAISPVGLAVGAVALAVGALYWAWKENFFGIQDITKNVFDWLKGVFADFPNTLSNLATKFGEWGSTAMTRLREGILIGKDWARNAIDVSLDYIKQANFGGMGQSFYEQAKVVINKLGEGFTASREWAKGQLNTVLTDVQNQGVAFAGGALAGRLYEGARTSILRFGEGLRSTAPNLAGDMGNAMNFAVGAFNTAMDSFKNHVYGVAANITTRIGSGLKSVNLGGAMDGALDGIINTFNAVMDGFHNHVWGGMQGIGTRISAGLADGIRRGIGSVMDALAWITDTMPGWVRDALGIHSPSRVFAEIGQNIMAGLGEGVQAAVAIPEMAIAGATQAITNSAVTNNSTSQSTTFNITQNGNNQGDGVENIRRLSLLYGSA